MPIERHVQAFEDQASILATMDVQNLWDRMLGEFLNEWTRLDRQGLPDAEMERALQAFMESLSDKPLEHLARQSSAISYNEGRSAEILSAHDRGEVDFVIRSEILDTKTCDVCDAFAKDPPIVEVGTPEYDYFKPPSLCLGGTNCRGFYVPISGEA
jgi:hypothetical protein